MRIKHEKIGCDDRNRKRDCKNSGQSAQGPDKHSYVGLGRHVPVANCRHGHDCPPKTLRNTFKIVLRICLKTKSTFLIK